MTDLQTMRAIIQADRSLEEPIAAHQKAHQNFETFNDDMYEKYHGQALVIALTELENTHAILGESAKDQEIFEKIQRELSTSLPGELNVNSLFTEAENEMSTKVLEESRDSIAYLTGAIKPIVLENGVSNVRTDSRNPYSPADYMTHELIRAIETDSGNNQSLAPQPGVGQVPDLTPG